MPSSGVRDNRLAFSPQVEVIPPIKESCSGEVVRDVFQHVLTVDFFQDGYSDIALIDLTNMIELRSVIPPVFNLVELT